MMQFFRFWKRSRRGSLPRPHLWRSIITQLGWTFRCRPWCSSWQRNSIPRRSRMRPCRCRRECTLGFAVLTLNHSCNASFERFVDISDLIVESFWLLIWICSFADLVGALVFSIRLAQFFGVEVGAASDTKEELVSQPQKKRRRSPLRSRNQKKTRFGLATIKDFASVRSHVSEIQWSFLRPHLC